MDKARSAWLALRRSVAANMSTAVLMVKSWRLSPWLLRRLDEMGMAPLLHESAPHLDRTKRTAPVEPKFGPKGLR
jgi:hypothetical protein